MKKLMPSALVAILVFCVNVSVFANTPIANVSRITIKNNTSKTVKVITSISPTLSWNITINGTTDTPIAHIPSHGQTTLFVASNKYDGIPRTGSLWVRVYESVYENGVPQAKFNMMLLKGWGIDLTGVTASSEAHFVISAAMHDRYNGTVDINPATSNSSRV